ncbi:MAG: hypothetical protein HC914_04575, partial [Chloroflexaceae bacterium]|nr:hypothetical protein [Chloroflexaceae bacterium]
ACWLVRQVRGSPVVRVRWLVLAVLLLALLLRGGMQTGTRYVLDNQPPDQVAAVALVNATLAPDERVLTAVPPELPLAKYSAIAHRAVVLSPDTADATLIQDAAQQYNAPYLLWDERSGAMPLADAVAVGQAGRYGLYRVR